MEKINTVSDVTSMTEVSMHTKQHQCLPNPHFLVTKREDNAKVFSRGERVLPIGGRGREDRRE